MRWSSAGDLGILDDELHPDGGLDIGAGSPLAARVGGRHAMLTEVGGLDAWTAGLDVATTLDPAVQPFLHDHRIDGTPVLPGVMGVEVVRGGGRSPVPRARTSRPSRTSSSSLRSSSTATSLAQIVVTARFTVDGDDLVARCRLVGPARPGQPDRAQTTVHFTGSVRLGTPGR